MSLKNRCWLLKRYRSCYFGLKTLGGLLLLQQVPRGIMVKYLQFVIQDLFFLGCCPELVYLVSLNIRGHINLIYIKRCKLSYADLTERDLELSI